jgi:predicted RNase H-like HicB family nuclease
MNISLTAVFKKVPEGYVAYVEELPGANTQGYTLDEARANLEEAIQMVLEANRILAEEQPFENSFRESYNLALV